MMIEHREAMLSLRKVRTAGEIREWHERIARDVIGNDRIAYSVEAKVDGIAIALTYEDGTLTRATSRGDGRTGSDLTRVAWEIGGIPKGIVGTLAKGRTEVRGEIFMDRATFNRFRKPGHVGGARNATVGTINGGSKYGREGLRFAAYTLIDPDYYHIAAQSIALARMESAGLPIVTPHLRAVGIEDAMAAVTAIDALALGGSIPFDVDGAVIKVDRIETWETIGATSRYPKWAIAYRFPAPKGGVA